MTYKVVNLNLMLEYYSSEGVMKDELLKMENLLNDYAKDGWRPAYITQSSLVRSDCGRPCTDYVVMVITFVKD